MDQRPSRSESPSRPDPSAAWLAPKAKAAAAIAWVVGLLLLCLSATAVESGPHRTELSAGSVTGHRVTGTRAAGHCLARIAATSDASSSSERGDLTRKRPARPVPFSYRATESEEPDERTALRGAGSCGTPLALEHKRASWAIHERTAVHEPFRHPRLSRAPPLDALP